MADVIRKATNRFTKGLVMDFSPENTQNEVLTHALNATLLTFNGNELSLQNDMGNARVETAYLPEGYMPVGTCEYGGIVYIVSYNPLEDKSQIGCFPSPERNVSNKELGISDAKLFREKFQKFNQGIPTGDIMNTTQYVLLKNDNLNPGDKFLVCAGKEIYNERLADLWVDKDGKYYENPDDDPKDFELVNNPVIALNVVSIEDSGKIVYLNSDIRQYQSKTNYSKEVNGTTESFEDIYKYHILGEMPKNGNTYEQASVDIDSYRNVLNSGYSVFKSKTSGKLAILAELITIDSYSVTHSLVPKENTEGCFDVVIHTEVSPEVTYDNYNLVPKLQYYHLKNSQGYLQTADTNGEQLNKSLFEQDKDSGVWAVNPNFLSTSLSNIYTPIVDDINLTSRIDKTGQFNFPVPDTYHGRMQVYEGDVAGSVDNKVYTKFTEGKYHRVKKDQVVNNRDYFTKHLNAKFYRYSVDGDYVEFPKENTLEESYTYYVKTTTYKYHDVQRNTKYQNGNDTLYKLASEPTAATEDEVKNKLIEKFQYVEVHSYREASSEELTDGTKIYTKDGNTYTTHSGPIDPTVTYYVLEEEQTLVSIGFDINRDDYPGEIYYYPTAKDYVEALEEDLEVYWNFEKYPKEETVPWGCPEILYWREEVEDYRQATDKELLEFKTSDLQFFYRTDYIYISDVNLHQDSNGQLFVVVPIDTYVSCERFIPTTDYNYIVGYDKPYHKDEPKNGFPNEGPISLFTVADFIPNNLKDDKTSLQYKDITLANIKIPREVSVNGLDLPFKYDYTLVPCMNFGRLDHLAVSNTVDFSKLHAFNQSDFTTWKYHIDNNQLRLTFGANIYDTYETDKVDGLVLEFYDLWGFAGSLEITDKKSYSGIFTKIIPLNSLNALSKNRIIGSIYSDAFNRNVNIVKDPKDDSKFLFNGKEVQFRGYNSGWRYVDNNEALGDDNDCGTLYSNLVYGVKTYLRRTKNAGQKNEYKEFIEKNNFFLYTLPIYNDYYYTINNFSSLTNPQLSLVLSYKLQDSSVKSVYEHDKLKNGYSEYDSDLVDQYLSGFLQGKTNLDLVRYYKYTGKTLVGLEIGLKQDYSNFNMAYSADINDLYSCKLQLISDDSESTYQVVVEGAVEESPEQSLNYNNKSGFALPMSINKLQFKDGPTREIKSGFKNYNFLNNTGTSNITIDYEFIVGYTVDITDIKTTLIQATTVCALYHQDSSGIYNTEDFGIYEQDGKYLSSAMFYNSGTSEQEIFGLCKQITTEASKTMIEQCQSITSVTTDAQEIKTAGKLNSGSALQQVIPYIGKLTFCQPHAHGLSETYGVNIHEGPNSNQYGIPPKEGSWPKYGSKGDPESGFGIAPRMYLYNHPLYNLSLNTKNAILYNSEFISTLDYESFVGYAWGTNTAGSDETHWVGNLNMRKYTGFTGEQIATFNKKLLKTMSSVYAYNPDYDSLAVNVGNVNVQSKQVKFTSNLINTYSDLKFSESSSLNDYVYLGPIKFSDYLKWMNIYSENSAGLKIPITTLNKDGKSVTLDQLQFVPDFTYCGTPESKYLVSSLTYNTPSPVELEDELSFKASSTLVVRHSDGTLELLNGTPNKKALYGYNSNLKKLIQLDVSNHTIADDGTLVLNSTTYSHDNQKTSISVSDEDFIEAVESYHSFNYDFVGVDEVTSPLEMMLDLRCDGSAETSILQYGPNSIILAVRRDGSAYAEGFNFSYDINLKPINSNEYTYSIKTGDALVSCAGVVLDPQIVTMNGEDSRRISLLNQSYEDLHGLLFDGFGTLVRPDGSSRGYMVEEIGIQGAYSTYADGQSISKHENIFVSNLSHFATEVETGSYTESNYIELYEFTIDHVAYEITRSSKLADSSDTVVRASITNNYSETIDHKYTVKDLYKEARLRGTSITLNDLVYEPNADGHRLFMRNNLCKYDSTYRGKLYYRDWNDGHVHSSWIYADTEHLNCLFLYTGPCFTTDNLEN